MTYSTIPLIMLSSVLFADCQGKEHKPTDQDMVGAWGFVSFRWPTITNESKSIIIVKSAPNTKMVVASPTLGYSIVHFSNARDTIIFYRGAPVNVFRLRFYKADKRSHDKFTLDGYGEFVRLNTADSLALDRRVFSD
ncbi:hypothetical protein [Hymenobacter jeollabukensis]|uniref:Lipocalin-like domain-containing protein n=1 Tax=Hymenobacter jeollabukensis TaxID=2025313 RepID=A0A5R8WPQ7_9BACT|nr:hypothetical protein [Hymenobacter jeollabukensis]TLM92306.1 hypothetical protein FDY95_12795 [Hymenobacter jeollabukensis]